MKITFLTPNVDISGGVRIILGYANRLSKKGHDVTVICPQPTFKKRTIKRIPIVFPTRFRLNSINFKPRWINVKADIKYVPSFDETYIPDADIVVATAWHTAPYVASYHGRKGRKFYLFMHYERLFDDGCSDVDKFTYRLPLTKIVISSCLQTLLKVKFNEESTLIPCPVDHDSFYPDRNGYNEDKVICMLHHRSEWKGTSDGVKAFTIAQEKHPNIKLIMYGSVYDENHCGYKYYHQPSTAKLRKIFNHSDIFLCSSWREGFGLPAAEAMTTKCAVVTTDNGGCRDYAMHEETALVSPPKRPEELAENIIRLIEDRALFERIAENGYQYIKKFNWENAVHHIEMVFQENKFMN